ncbi:MULTISPECIES: YidC/Oxa1 family membrane protein insertase [Dehalobacter]|uniref:YidC/Oxa1 family membrane protein insertase n=1 Tax=Dehalobacter TaxID=56112 RepID=UPI00258AC10F|nr:YidC/Oxa1 family membrane protein insertase [Dehalobacter sp.]MDJ0304648.1 YidC/Oxa1 family membrane protein insertase [Dehalobacter sp.]
MNMISTVLSQLLAFLVSTTGDWFIAVALITLGIKLLLFPLSIKQQKVQLLTANLTKARTILSGKFHNQIKKVNSESMKIASKYKINPLFTFATLIIQAPVFFSLYVAITHLSIPVGSILIPWVSDLHMADHLHILPVIAGYCRSASDAECIYSRKQKFTDVHIPGCYWRRFSVESTCCPERLLDCQLGPSVCRSPDLSSRPYPAKIFEYPFSGRDGPKTLSKEDALKT